MREGRDGLVVGGVVQEGGNSCVVSSNVKVTNGVDSVDANSVGSARENSKSNNSNINSNNNDDIEENSNRKKKESEVKEKIKKKERYASDLGTLISLLSFKARLHTQLGRYTYT